MMRKLMSLTVVLAMAALTVQAADTKPIKSDVSIKQDDKSAKAKVGEIVEIKIDNPSPGSNNSTGLTDLKITLDKSKVLKDQHDERDTVGLTAEGKAMAGSGFKSIYIYPAMEGKAMVTVEFKKGGKVQKHEYAIEVKGKK